MAEKLVTQYELDKKQFTTAVNDIIKDYGRLDDAAEKSGEEIEKPFKKGGKAAKDFDNQLGDLEGRLKRAFTVTAIALFIKEATLLSAKLESIKNSLNFAAGSAEGGARSFEFIRNISKQLGLELVSTANSFKLFGGAAQQSGLSFSETQRIFTSVATAVTAMGLSADDANGVFLALSQILGKGKVQAEELRGQIGERIPGAFAIAARAVGLTEKELNKLLETGGLLSKDFLPAFATELQKTFEGALPKAINSTNANLNRAKNIITELTVSIGDRLAAGFNDLAGYFTKGDKAINPLIESLSSLRGEFNAEIAVLQSSNISTSARSELLKRINASYKDYLPNILTEKTSLSELKTVQDQVNASILQRIIVETQKEKIQKASVAFVNAEIAQLELQVNLEKNLQAQRANTDPMRIRALESEEKILRNSLELTKGLSEGAKKEINTITAAYGQLLEKFKETPFVLPVGDSTTDADIKKLWDKMYFESLEAADRIYEANRQNAKKERIAAEKEDTEKNDKLLKNTIKTATDANELATEIEISGTKEGTKARLEAQLKGLEREKEILRMYGEDTLDIEKKIQKQKTEIADKGANDRKEIEKAAANAGLEIANELSNQIFSLKEAQLNAETNAQLKALDEEREAAERNGKLTLAQETEFARREAEIKTQQAQKQRQADLAEILVRGAMAQLNILATSPPPLWPILLPAAAVLTGIQYAFAASQPLPQFEGGTLFSPQGKAIVDEKGAELRVSPSGQMILGSNKGPNIVDLQRGTKIFTADQTRAFLTMADVNSGSLMRPVHYNEEKRIEQAIKVHNNFNDKRIVNSITETNKINKRLVKALLAKSTNSPKGRNFN